MKAFLVLLTVLSLSCNAFAQCGPDQSYIDIFGFLGTYYEITEGDIPVGVEGYDCSSDDYDPEIRLDLDALDGNCFGSMQKIKIEDNFGCTTPFVDKGWSFWIADPSDVQIRFCSALDINTHGDTLSILLYADSTCTSPQPPTETILSDFSFKNRSHHICVFEYVAVNGGRFLDIYIDSTRVFSELRYINSVQLNTFSSFGPVDGVHVFEGQLPTQQEIEEAYLWGTTERVFIRGDANQDGGIDNSDAIALIGHFNGSQVIQCKDAGDVDDNGKIDLADIIYLLAYVFQNGTPPLPPFPYCELDYTFDSLDCAASNCP